MIKKLYMTPESEELMMEIESSILAGSGASNIEDGDPANMDGDDDNEDDGF